MTPRPTGRVLRTVDGYSLIATRIFHAPIEDVWASVTEPERTARWFGPWRGDAGPGKTIEVQWAFEEGQPWGEMRIEVCEPPRRLKLVSGDEASGFSRLELQLNQSGETTELQLRHHLNEPGEATMYGSGWEYYMDMLVSAREGTPRPSWDEGYGDAMNGYFEAEAAKARQS